MVDAKEIGLFVGIALPSIFLTLLSADALLVVAEDVLLLSLLQIVLIGVYMYKF
jgi:hypothetical protein